MRDPTPIGSPYRIHLFLCEDLNGKGNGRSADRGGKGGRSMDNTNIRKSLILFPICCLVICMAGCSGSGGGGHGGGGGGSVKPHWSTQLLGTVADDVGYGAAVDSKGNIYSTGSTGGFLDGNLNAGNLDLFLVKYNPSGVKQWTRQLGTGADDIGRGVAIDGNDNLYVTGYTGGALDGNVSAGNFDIFLLKYNSSGVKQWTRQLGTISDDVGRGLSIDSKDKIFITGSTGGALDGEVNAGNFDIFLVKYDSEGVLK